MRVRTLEDSALTSEAVAMGVEMDLREGGGF